MAGSRNLAEKQISGSPKASRYHLKLPLRFRCSYMSRKPSLVTALVIRLAIAGEKENR
jgi:hypothetical protein